MALYDGNGSDLKPVFHPKGANGVLVGCNRYGIQGIDPDQGLFWIPGHGGHALTFGMTGSGKGLQIIGALTQYSGSTLTIDPTGSNAWATAERRRQMGHRVVILDPFGEVNKGFASLVGQSERTTRFNPLSVINPKSPDFSDDVMMLAEAVIITQGNDPHWCESARALVAGLIAAVVEGNPGKASFRQVRKLLTLPLRELAETIKILHARNPNSLGGRTLQRFADGGKEVGSIRSTADTQTFPFESLALLDSMETDVDAFDFAELATRRVDVFLVLPVDRLTTYGRWLRLIITLAIRAITRSPRPPNPPVLFILDELGTINPGGGLRMIEQAYGLMRAQGIRIWGFFQSLKQMQTDYPNSWETFIANSSLVQLLFVNDNITASYFSDYVGQKPVFRTMYGHGWVRFPTTKAAQPHYETNTRLLNTFRGGETETYQRQSGYIDQIPIGEEPSGYEMILRPDEIMSISGAGESLCLFAGGHHYHMRKVNYYKDERYRGRYRDSPHHARPVAPKPSPDRPAPAAAAPRPAAAPKPAPQAAPSRPAVAPWSRPLSSGRAAPAPPRPAAGKPSGWFAARREAAAAREQAKARAKSEAAAIDERARYARMIRDAK